MKKILSLMALFIIQMVLFITELFRIQNLPANTEKDLFTLTTAQS